MRKRPGSILNVVILCVLSTGLVLAGSATDLHALAYYEAWAQINIDLTYGASGSSSTQQDKPDDITGGTASSSGDWLVNPVSGFDYSFQALIDGEADYPPDSTATSRFSTDNLVVIHLEFTNNSDVDTWFVELGYQYNGVLFGGVDDPADPNVEEFSEATWFYSLYSSELGQTIESHQEEGDTSVDPFFEGSSTPFTENLFPDFTLSPGETERFHFELRLYGNAYSRLIDDGSGLPGGDPTAVPEPSTLLLLGAGMMGLVGFRRKFQA